MPDTQTLSSAGPLAASNTVHRPNESAAYRTARNSLLVEEIELRLHIERVSAHWRALPRGGNVPHDFEFVSETGAIGFSSVFRDTDTLVVYSMPYGAERKAPCHTCRSFLSA
jgi:predicted dithiol-disulfide oxidoreductase (DUF899 family)